jgi:predicted permease
MTLLHRLASVLRWLLRRQKAEQELDDELQAFVDLSAAQMMRDGVPPEEARRSAKLDLGGVEQAKELVRGYRHGAVVDELGRDLRYAVRMFRKNLTFVLIVVLTLTLGIGANTAIFTLIDALMLRSLPVRNPQELVLLKMHMPGMPAAGDSLSYAIVRALSDQNEIFAGVAGFSSTSFNVGPPDSVTKVSGAVVNGSYYDTLGLYPAIGRLLTRDDDTAAAPVVAVISYGYWERQFARSPNVIGRPILINRVPVTIVGVSPQGFVGTNVGSRAEITLTLAAFPQVNSEAAPLLGPGNFWLRALARPQTGLSIGQARTRLNAVWRHESEPAIPPHWPADRQKSISDSVFEFSPGGTGYTYLREMYRKPLGVLMAMVSLVLLIACANVASLLLARASTRRQEIAVRLALGAGRGRITRQLLIESTLLSFAGASLGIGLASLLSRFLVYSMSTGPAQVAFDLTPNWHVLAFTGAVSIATAILFGVAPALHATAGILSGTTRMSPTRSRLLPSLISAQVALSLVLLIGAGLFVRTLKNLKDVDPGFSRDGALLVNFEGRRTGVSQEILHDVERVPGVVAASLATHTPLSGALWTEPAVPKGQAIPPRDNAIFVGAAPGFFRTMRTPLLSGREFAERDSAESSPVAVISEAFSKKHFPNQNSVGQHLSAKVRGQDRNLEIVGVVKDTNVVALRRAPYPTVYVSYAQLTGDFPTTLVIRTIGPLGRVISTIEKMLQAKLPDSPSEVRLLSAQVDATIVQERLMAILATAFGVLALVTACIGLYGLLAYTVARRTKEIGIRMALGARRSRVIATVVAGAARLLFIGVVLGLPAGWAVSHWVKAMLFGVTPTDPLTITGAILLLATAALLAAYMPAVRASRVDPIATLRHE